ncbi:MAG: RNA polymerase sigma factor [Candidatus Kapabacteria bacterium]|jgi:RNA polymerase sigma-70 factor (ECF subfamily)|nr:RNA polymerase sigma factor [Candidatus Kapabacteria bacterium]
MTEFARLSDEALSTLLHDESKRETAFRELYGRHKQRIYAYCVRVLGDSAAAEDIFQETFVRFFDAAKTDRTMTNVAAFLLRIARNLCLNHKRDSKPTLTLEDYDIPYKPLEYGSSELLRLITTALELLDYDHREAFVLRKYDGMSFLEIAEITNTTETNARSRVHRAQAKIREILAPYLADIDQHL